MENLPVAAFTMNGRLVIKPNATVQLIIEEKTRGLLSVCKCGQRVKAGYISNPGTGGIEEIIVRCTCGRIAKEPIDIDETLANAYPSLVGVIERCVVSWNMLAKGLEMAKPPLVELYNPGPSLMQRDQAITYRTEIPIGPAFFPHVWGGALAFVHRRGPEEDKVITGGLMTEMLEPFKRLFFCGYRIKEPALILLPRNNMMGAIRDCMRAWSAEGGVWINKPEMETIQIN